MTGIRNWLLLTVILLSSLTSTAGLSGAKKTNRIASDSAGPPGESNCYVGQRPRLPHSFTQR